MIRRSRNLLRPLTFMTVLLMLAFAPAALAQDDEEEEVAKVEVVNRAMIVNNIQFDSWVFGNIGAANAGVARNKLDSLLTLSVEDLERSCSLTPAQKKKLMLAGRGDIKRFFDHVEEIRKKFEKTRNDQNQFGNVWQDIQTLQSAFQAGVFGDESIFSKSVRATLSAEQVAKHEKIAQDRLMFRYQVAGGPGDGAPEQQRGIHRGAEAETPQGAHDRDATTQTARPELTTGPSCTCSASSPRTRSSRSSRASSTRA